MKGIPTNNIYKYPRNINRFVFFSSPLLSGRKVGIN